MATGAPAEAPAAAPTEQSEMEKMRAELEAAKAEIARIKMQKELEDARAEIAKLKAAKAAR